MDKILRATLAGVAGLALVFGAACTDAGGDNGGDNGEVSENGGNGGDEEED